MKEPNNIDNQLRQLENQSLPDLSRQDQHWQEMQKMLQPGLAPVKPVSPTRLWKWLAVAGIAVVAFLLINNWVTEKKEKTAIVTITPITSKNGETSIIDTPETPITTTDSIPGKKSEAAPLKIAVKPKPAGRTGYASIVADPCDKCGTDWLNDPLPDSNNLTAKTPEPGTTLASFFAQLEKPSQEFVIDNSRDTVINGKDGTALLIPANTFTTNGKVTLILKEYYSYEDIITNKLCTTSDGKQLVTGGMIHLVATTDGKEVDIAPNKSIQWLVPDTTGAIGSMELFERQIRRTDLGNFERQIKPTSIGDTAAENLETINWVPGNRSFTRQWSSTFYKVLDLSNSPYKERATKKGVIGKFHYSTNAKLSADQAAQMIKEKYGYYKVKMIKKKEYSFFRKLFRGVIYDPYWDNSKNDIGDSAWVLPSYAATFQLKVSDTLTTLQNSVVYEQGTYVKKTFKNINLSTLANRFSVDIRQLGWINCDRFYNDKREKLDYYVKLKDTADKYYTVLVFDKIRSMVKGVASGNKVLFSGVPKGEPAKIICIGIHDGKAVAAMEALSPGKTSITELKFEETSPAEFRQQAASMDK